MATALQESNMTVPVVLSIGTFDSSGGAGTHADVKAAASVGCFLATVLVGVTAQNTMGITKRHSIPLDMIEAQFAAINADLEISALKVGATWSPSVISAIAAISDRLDVPCVIDPVMGAASGAILGKGDSLRNSICREYLPRATLLTPNLQEARTIAELPSADAPELASGIRAQGASAVVVTMGDDPRGDYFLHNGNGQWLGRVPHPEPLDHGAGCTHSTLVASLLARGLVLRESVVRAGVLSSKAVHHGLAEIGGGRHPVDALNLQARWSDVTS
jgi:hydroxymethylpyrimidine/phosphomethylpyrimidine kinase